MSHFECLTRNHMEPNPSIERTPSSRRLCQTLAEGRAHIFIDWLIYGLFVFGVKLLNVTAFKLKLALKLAAWALNIVLFIVSLVVLSTLKVLMCQAIFDSGGVSISPQ